MANGVNRKTIGFTVPRDYEFRGGEVKRELNEFFQFIVDQFPQVYLEYPKKDKIIKILSWD